MYFPLFLSFDKRSLIRAVGVTFALLLTLIFAADAFGQRRHHKAKKPKYKGDESTYGHKPQPPDCKQYKAFGQCPKIGCGGTTTEEPLNRRKNIDPVDLSTVTATDIPFETLRNMQMPAGYTPGDEDRSALKGAGEGTVYRTVADMTDIRWGSQESCNCKLWLAKDTDNHMILIDQKVINDSVTTGDKWEQHSFTAEFTPRAKKGHSDFRVSVVDKLIKDSSRKRLKVRLTGTLMFDDYHEVHPLANGRETNWELHPVWRFEYCPNTKCTLESDTGWKKLK